MVGGARRVATARRPLTICGGTYGSDNMSAIKPWASNRMAPSTDEMDA